LPIFNKKTEFCDVYQSSSSHPGATARPGNANGTCNSLPNAKKKGRTDTVIRPALLL
jgi:hypothetical protein